MNRWKCSTRNHAVINKSYKVHIDIGFVDILRNDFKIKLLHLCIASNNILRI